MLFLVGTILSSRLGWAAGEELLKGFWEFTREMLLVLPFVFILIGLMDVWIPKKRVEDALGEGSGIRGILLVILLAFFNAGPLYAAFPLALILRQKGCSLRNIFIFLGAFSALKIPMLSFEMGFMGVKFSLLRLLFTLPVFVGIAILLEALLGRDYEMKLQN
ncbi:MAG: permease [bacterium]